MQQKTGSTLYYFTLSMTLIYAALGIYIIFSENVEKIIPGEKKNIIGVLLILYAAYRAYRLYRINQGLQNDK